ncbi:MAG: stage III sporulation protein AF [Oscillospiraceae bacterium]|nr:stage III sporulation protein AF [Oscillospiraceae bacterium]
MNFLKEWAFSIFITVLIITIFSMIIPKGQLDKVMKFSLSLFFLVALVTPFVSKISSINFGFKDEIEVNTQKMYKNDILEKSNEDFISLTEKNISNNIGNILKQNNINPKKITTNININDNTSISINNLVILLDKKDINLEQKVKEVILKEVLYEPEIEYE